LGHDFVLNFATYASIYGSLKPLFGTSLETTIRTKSLFQLFILLSQFFCELDQKSYEQIFNDILVLCRAVGVLNKKQSVYQFGVWGELFQEVKTV